MKAPQVKQGMVYAGSDSVSYVPEDCRPYCVVDAEPWVLEWSRPRRLRRPAEGEKRYHGELAREEAPSAFLGFWVIIGSPYEYSIGRLHTAAARSRPLVHPVNGGVEPTLPGGLDLRSEVVMARQLHMPWDEHVQKMMKVA